MKPYSEMDIGVDVSFSAQRWHSLIEAVMQTHFEPNIIAFYLVWLQNLKILVIFRQKNAKIQLFPIFSLQDIFMELEILEVFLIVFIILRD